MLPKDWCNRLIMKLPKKRDIMDCSNWLGITLLSISSKSRQKNLHADERSYRKQTKKTARGAQTKVGCIYHILYLYFAQHHGATHRMDQQITPELYRL